MTLYHNRQTESLIGTLEYVEADGRKSREFLTFCYLNHADRVEEVKQLLAYQLPHQKLAGTTELGGRPVLILRGQESVASIIDQLRSPNLDFVKAEKSKSFDPWKWRGLLSNYGQGLQLLSAAFKKEKGFDHSVLGFAVFNIAANFINMIFGGESKPDPHRLRLLKNEFNDQLAPYVAENAALPDPEATLTKGRKQKKSEAAGDAIYGFLKRNSVVFGEIGLRYIGAFNLAFPILQWTKAGQQAFKATEGSFGAKMKASIGAAGKNFHNGQDPWIFYAGIAYLVGKTIALCSKVPDPYDPKPHSTLDKIRENILFKVSTGIETGAAAALAYNGLKPGEKKIPENPDGVRLFTNNRSYSSWLPSFMKSKKFITRDWFGAVGGGLFTAGLAIRFAAPFGKREVNLKELYAHMAQGLAQVPADKRPQLVAESAAAIKAQFTDQSIEFGTIYAALAAELERYQQVTLLKSSPMLALNPKFESQREAPTVAPSPATPSPVIDAASARASAGHHLTENQHAQRAFA
ncbi:MAG: hypothetical protein ACKVOE_06340 [Rickettsiales bacterium]